MWCKPSPGGACCSLAPSWRISHACAQTSACLWGVQVGYVQSRWVFTNPEESYLTKAQEVRLTCSAHG